MTQPAKSQEPSMEEILASIRRIIADDDASKRTPDAPKTATAAPKLPSEPSATTMPGPVDFVPSSSRNGSGGQSSDILELTDSMTSPTPRTAPEMSFGEGLERPSLQNGRDAQSQLLSRSTSAAVDSAFSALAQNALSNNSRSLRIWCASCCGRYSKLGLTKICPAWSSGWCVPKSNAFPAGTRQLAPQPSLTRPLARPQAGALGRQVLRALLSRLQAVSGARRAFAE